jgi:transcription antitermination factor NusG
MGLKWRQLAQNEISGRRESGGKMNLNGFENAWFAIQVRPKYEFLTSTILRSKGYEEFVPSYVSIRRWSDRSKKLNVPLFTGYVFCRFNEHACAQVITTPGVIRIVGTGSRIMAIEDAEIEAIRTAVNSGKPVEPCAYLAVGDRVCVTEGAMAGIQGILVRYSNRHQLILSVELIHGSMAIEIDARSAVKIDPPKSTAGSQLSAAH